MGGFVVWKHVKKCRGLGLRRPRRGRALAAIARKCRAGDEEGVAAVLELCSCGCHAGDEQTAVAAAEQRMRADGQVLRDGQPSGVLPCVCLGGSAGVGPCLALFEDPLFIGLVEALRPAYTPGWLTACCCWNEYLRRQARASWCATKTRTHTGGRARSCRRSACMRTCRSLAQSGGRAPVVASPPWALRVERPVAIDARSAVETVAAVGSRGNCPPG